MAKFKIKMKLQNFELEIEGSRDDVPIITQAVGNQIAGLLAPATDIVEGEVVDRNPALSPNVVTIEPSRRKKRNPTTSGQKNSKIEPLQWEHDPSKWGTPKIEWKSPEKAIWLIYVLSEAKGITELSSSEIAVTFNEHF